MAETEETPTEQKKVGFFERRWRMVKAAAKQTYDYLFDIKTYIGAAVMFGGVAYLSTTPLGASMGLSDKLGWFGLKGAGPMDVLLRMGTFVGMSAAIRTGIAMAKESYACNNCHTGQTVPDVAAGIKQAQEIAQAAEKHLGYNHLGQSQQFSPQTDLPQIKLVSTGLNQPAGPR